MRYYGSIIIFNKYFDKILLVEYDKNKYMLPCIENKTNVNINMFTLTLLNDFCIYKNNIYFLDETFYILNKNKYVYYMICSVQDVNINSNVDFDDSEYFDVKFINFSDIKNKNLIDKIILEKIDIVKKNNNKNQNLLESNGVCDNKLFSISTLVKIMSDYYAIRNYILYYLRNINFKTTIENILKYVKKILSDKITIYDCIISIIFDTKERIINQNELYFCTYRHDIGLKNQFIVENTFNKLTLNNINNLNNNTKYYLLINTKFNEYIYDINLYSTNLEFILTNTLDKQITKKIYDKYTSYYIIDVYQCLEDSITFYIIDNNIITTLGVNNMLLTKYILGFIIV